MEAAMSDRARGIIIASELCMLFWLGVALMVLR